MLDWKTTIMFIISIAIAYFISEGAWLIGIIAFVVIMGVFTLIDGIIIELIINASKPKPQMQPFATVIQHVSKIAL